MGRLLSPVRVVAALTTAYGVAITVSPRLLAGPCQMLDERGAVPPRIKTLVRAVGTRDAALAALLVLRAPQSGSGALSAARIVADAADAVWFAGLPLPAGAKAKVSGAAAAWASLQALAYWYERRR